LKQSDIINSFLLKFNKTKVAADEFIAFQIEENDLVAYKVAWIDWSPDFWIEIGRLKNCS